MNYWSSLTTSNHLFCFEFSNRNPSALTNLIKPSFSEIISSFYPIVYSRLKNKIISDKDI